MQTQQEVKQAQLEAIGHLIAYVSGRWYEEEHGQVELRDQWYGPTLSFLVRHSHEVAHAGSEVRS
jgi:hypothetical protein